LMEGMMVELWQGKGGLIGAHRGGKGRLGIAFGKARPEEKEHRFVPKKNGSFLGQGAGQNQKRLQVRKSCVVVKKKKNREVK